MSRTRVGCSDHLAERLIIRRRTSVPRISWGQAPLISRFSADSRRRGLPEEPPPAPASPEPRIRLSKGPRSSSRRRGARGARALERRPGRARAPGGGARSASLSLRGSREDPVTLSDSRSVSARAESFDSLSESPVGVFSKSPERVFMLRLLLFDR